MSVLKRCTCPEARWPKCGDPWYMQKFRYQGKSYEPNLTRYALEILGETISAKFDAERIAGTVRDRIRAGTYLSAKAKRRTPVAVTPAGASVSALAPLFDAERIAPDETKKPNSKINDRAGLASLVRFFGDREMAGITIQDLVSWRGSENGIAASTWNKRRTLVGQFFEWAAWTGRIPKDPIASASPKERKLLKRGKATKRRRRISDDELANLIEAAKESRYGQSATRLHALIIAAIETGCRKGELLALKWADVHRPARTLNVRGEEEGAGKTGERPVTISRPLDALLETLRTDAAGAEMPRTAYVFGNEYGDRVKRISKAWETAVLRAHNLTPSWTDGGLDAASRAALQAIDLHFHDLRHEAACRWLESGCFDLGEISEKLGHTSIAQTATYLHAVRGVGFRRSQDAYDELRARQAVTPVKAVGNGSANGKRGKISIVRKGHKSK